MAARGKRGLELPPEDEVPEGPHRQLLIGLHRIYAHAGQPGLRKIAQGLKDDDDAPTTLNYQAIGKILNGKTIPTAPQLVSLIFWLSKKAKIPGKEIASPVDSLLELRELIQNGKVQPPGEGVNKVNSGADSPSTSRMTGRNSERKLLACMLRAKDAIADAVQVVTGDAFFDELHSVTFTTLLQLYADGIEITVDAAEQALRIPLPSRLDVRDYLRGLMEEAVDPREAEFYAERVVAHAKLRRIAKMGKRFTELINGDIVNDLAGIESIDDETAAVESVVSLVEEEVFSFMREMGEMTPLSDVIEGALDEIEGIGTRGHNPAVLTGFKKFDDANAGFRPGELTVVAGASGMGKSTLSLNFIRACSITTTPHPSLLVSLQMDKDEMMARIFAAEGKVALSNIRSGQMAEEDWTRLADIMPTISAAPITMQDSARYTLTELLRTGRRQSLFGDLRLVVIDSLDLLYLDKKESADPDRDLPLMARELRNLAKELHIAIVALLQIDTPSVRYDNVPTLQHIPPGLERFADVVMLLHRPEVYERDSFRAGEADIIIAKNRMGSTMTVRTAFQGRYARFVEIAS
ncbi:replicative DNA helicase [Streptomyces sp. NPDC060235]|uniref:replicative DNA helicase n=1 Tax=Streptomyces sp. NPDC060235 TaxID=3347080 RepID=UPI003664F28B